MPVSRRLSTKPAMTEPAQADPTWFVYLLRCADGSLYCGITTHLERRLAEHNGDHGAGARYTRSRRPVELAYHERMASRADAACREAELKRLSRSAKLALVGLASL
jgi:putative endonuclease